MSRIRGFARSLVPARGPARRLALVTLAHAAGLGMFLSSSTIFFTTVVGLSPGDLALCLSAAGLPGFLATVPAGRHADRHGPWLLLVVSHGVFAIGCVAYMVVDSVPAYAVVTCLVTVAETIGSPLRGALIYALFDSAEATLVRAQTRSLFNLGFTAGTGLSALALAVGTHTAFVVLLGGVAALRLASVCLLGGLRPERRIISAAVKRSWAPLRDVRFLAATFLGGVLELFQPILSIGLPLWFVAHIDGPTWLMASVTALNTVLVVLFQVPVSRGSDTVVGAARLLARAGLFLALGCVLFALSQGRVTWLAMVVLFLGVAVLTIGEVGVAAGLWGLSFALPPQDRIGEYQGVFALGRGLQQTVGPSLVTVLVIGVGAMGWLVIAAVLAASGLAAYGLFGRRTASALTLSSSQ